MGYSIQYPAKTASKFMPVKVKKVPHNWWLAVGIGIVIIGLFLARNPLRNVLFPGDPEVTDAALEKMVSAIQEGEDLYSAAQVFCGEVVNSAQQYTD